MFYFILVAVAVVALFLIFRDDHDRNTSTGPGFLTVCNTSWQNIVHYIAIMHKFLRGGCVDLVQYHEALLH